MLQRVRTLARRAAARRNDWLRPQRCMPDAGQGIGVCVLHEEADHELAAFVASWLPNRGTPPHDHDTREGVERNTFWKRLDDGRRPGHAT
jgi:predicted metal-dependent enzyme (double-stranded beta helix superfamily)